MKKFAFILLCSHAVAGLWVNAMLGADGTHFDDASFSRDHESMWIEGLSKRISLGYMFHFGLLRTPIALEWSWDNFSQRVGKAQSIREATYQLSRQWTAIVRPGMHLGDGFVYTLASMEDASVNDTLIENKKQLNQQISLFPFSHFGLGLAFAVAPQTELMAEVRFSQKLSKEIYSYVRGEEVALPTSSTNFEIYNTQLMIGVSINL